MENFFEKSFHLKEHNTNTKTELVAGFTTFMTMAYILAINPSILSQAGMDAGAVFTATAIASFVATAIMAFYANYPFALAPGMGLNAFFAYSVVLGKGHSWQFALTAVFIEGLIFILLTFTNVREAIVNGIPKSVKQAISVGIGLFIAFIGLRGANIVVPGEGIPLDLGDITSPEAIVCFIGLTITVVLLVKQVRGAILLGILISTIVGIFLGVTQLPSGHLISAPPSIKPVFMKLEWNHILSADMIIIMITFLFVDMFDTIGTLVGVSTKAGLVDENGNLPHVKKALFADAVGTAFGALLGTSTVTTYVESASGVAEGGRTGLTALTTGVLFLVALLLSPIFLMIPSAATAPALITVGLFMMSPIKEIDLDDFTEAVPAFLTILMMPLAYSIAQGIVFGIVSYALLKLLTGRYKEASPVLYILAFLFILKIALHL
jgi:xanthine/uracil permease family protein